MNNSQREEVYRVINSLETIEDIQEVSRMLNDRYNYIQKGLKYQFQIGDNVSFQGKWDNIEHGVIVKMGRGRTITVRCGATLWTVSPSVLLKELDDA